MGIFDALTNLTPDQNQGLLAAAAAMLQGAGDPRRPFGAGQALGTGLQAFQQSLIDSEQRRIQKEQNALNSKLLGLKISDAESDLANQAAQRERAKRLQEFYQQGAAPNFAQMSAATGGGLAPTVENAAKVQQAIPGGGGANNLFAARLNEAQRLRAAGFGPEADAAEAAALKFQPKVKGWEKVTQNGRVLFAPFFEDGSSGAPVPLDVAEKLEKLNLGGTTQLVGELSGAPVRSFKNTASPESILSAATTRRGQDLTFQSAGLDRAQRAQTEKAPTEFQGKSAAFGLRAQEADKILSSLQGKFSPAAINSKLAVQETPLIGGILGAATNLGLSDADQQAEQAQRDFTNAVLRQESGAAIGADEFDNARKQYFPQPGDSAAVIQQKARNRQLAIQGLNSNAGRARMSAPAGAGSGGWSIQRVGE